MVVAGGGTTVVVETRSGAIVELVVDGLGHVRPGNFVPQSGVIVSAAVRYSRSLNWRGIANALWQLSTVWPQPWFASFVTQSSSKLKVW